MSTEKNVFTIVLNWNNLNDTAETITCLLNQVVNNHTIILVDNNSEQSIRNEIITRFPGLIFINNESNLGYTGGNNIGIRYALQNGADIIIIANNDIYIDDRYLISKIVSDFIEHENKVSIIGPKLLHYGQHNKVQEAGTTFFYANRDKCYLNDFMVKERDLSERLRYFDGVTGAFMAVKKDVFEKIGLFDEKLFMYADETDFCYRAWANNLLIAVDDSLVVYHKGSIDGNKTFTKPLPVYYSTRNSLYFLKKHKRTITHYNYFLRRHFRDRLAIIYHNLRKLCFRNDVMVATIRGLFDGIFNRMGKRF